MRKRSSLRSDKIERRNYACNACTYNNPPVPPVKRDSPAVSSVRVKAKTPAFHRYGEGINLAQGSHNDWNEGVLGHEEYPFRRGGAIHFHPPRAICA